jgi:Cytochrome c554 and c-prime
MTRIPFTSLSISRVAAAAVALVALFGLVLAQGGKDAKDSKPAGAAKYIGADKCKNCHSTDASGNQFAAWQKAGHAKAFATLASDEAKKIAKEKGIDDPQKSDKCVKCHETAFGLPADMIKKGFDATMGVQCESCHGPGEAHMKARMAAAMKAEGDTSKPQPIPAGEILSNVDEKTCATCHNSESPTFKPFCYCERVAKIAHFDPRKQHPKEAAPCSCEKCKAGKCPVGACGPDAKK